MFDIRSLFFFINIVITNIQPKTIMYSPKNSHKVLLVGPENKTMEYINTFLSRNGFQTSSAFSMNDVIQKAIVELPNIILCNYELAEADAFQVYNLLENSVLKKGIPFLVITEEFKKNQFQMGLELGVDNFIFLPINEDKVLKKIRTLLKKLDEHKSFEKAQFNLMFEQSPIGMIIMCQDKVERVNNAFYKIIGVPEFDFETTHPREFFISEGRDEDKQQFYNCCKGLIESCTIHDVLLSKRKGVVDMYVSHLGDLTTNQVLVQIMETTAFKSSFKWAPHNNEVITETKKTLGITSIDIHNLLTKRELEVCKLSSKGYPIKQIAALLGISKRTVEKHRSNLMRKTNTSNIIEAIGKVYQFIE